MSGVMMMMKKIKKFKHIVSYGGGVNSTAMIIWLVKNKKQIDYVVFSDVGDELPATYEFIENHMKPYLQKHNIEFVFIKKRVHGTEKLSDNLIRRKKFASMVWRACTRDFKVKPIHKFYKSLKVDHIFEYMGIDYGEVRRMKPSGVEWITKEYPLVDSQINREQCENIIKNEGMPSPGKSGCWHCPFNNSKRWLEIKKNYPDLFEKARLMEANSTLYPKQKLIKIKNNVDAETDMCDEGSCMT